VKTQSNPVIFVTLGQANNILRNLSANLDGITEGIAYITPESTFDETGIKAEIGRVWREFLQKGQNSADIVRVNYVLGTDETALLLPTLRQYVEKYLTALYPAGILADIYCLLDDDRLLENEDSRKQVMVMLQEAEQAKIYLLSNLNSRNVFLVESDTAKTITMLTLFKDCIPDLYVTGADASRYNELYFADNCYAKHGNFLTASSVNITVPQDGLKALLAAEILSFGKDTHLDSGNILDESIFYNTQLPYTSTVSKDYLLGLAIPEINNKYEMFRRQWIATLFGERLEQLVELSPFENDPLPNLIDEQMNFFDAIRYTGEGGVYQTFATDALESTKDELQRAEDDLHRWLEAVPNFDASEKRRLSPFVMQETWMYDMAHQYLLRQTELNEIANKIAVLEARCKQIDDIHHNLQSPFTKRTTVVDELTLAAQVIDDALAPFSPKATDYFRGIFKNFAAENHAELLELTAKMTTALLTDTFEDYLELVDEYVNETVLKSPLFNKPIMDILNDIITGRDIAVALGDWVFNNRQWDIRLKTGYANLHTEINIFMPAQMAANVKKRYEERGLGRMNLFADENADSVTVLYHAGAFSLQDLYYAGLYIGD